MRKQITLDNGKKFLMSGRQTLCYKFLLENPKSSLRQIHTALKYRYKRQKGIKASLEILLEFKIITKTGDEYELS